MKQSNSFQDFDNEQHLRRLAARRHQRGIYSVQLPDTHDWVFGPDLDLELDEVRSQFVQPSLEVQSCH